MKLLSVAAPAVAAVVLVSGGIRSCSVPGEINVNLVPSIVLVPPHPPHQPLGIVHGRLAWGPVPDPPPSGVVTMELQWRDPGSRKWHFAGKDTKGNPWIPGTSGSLDVYYSCFNSGLFWRTYTTYDGRNSAGTPVSGSGVYPSKRGRKITC